MACCQQYQSQTCGDTDQQKPQAQPHMQEQILRVSSMAYAGKDLDIENGIPNGRVTLLPSAPGKPNQIWEKKEIPCNNDNDQQKPGPIQRFFVLVNPVAKQVLRTERDEVVPVPNKGSYDESMFWTEADGYIIKRGGKVWTAEGGNQSIKIKPPANTGQKFQQWNIKLI